VWNQNSYHWEEKSVNDWAEQTLKKLLSNYTYDWNEAHLFVAEVKTFKGESGVSIRKGKKLVTYDYEIRLQWKIEMKDPQGEVYAKTSGYYEFPELSNEEADNWECRVTMGHDEEGIQKMLEQLIRSFVPKDLKDKIKKEFVQELEKK